MPYKKILVAYDGSKAAEDALEQAIMLVKDNESTQLDVIHVYNIPNFMVGEAIFTPPAGHEQEVIAFAQAIADKAKLLLQDTAHNSVTLHYGNPAKIILELADKNQYDLIVMGSKGISGIKEFMIGSVSHNVVLHAKIPVLIVK